MRLNPLNPQRQLRKKGAAVVKRKINKNETAG
jgi:hypothetical protein